MEFEIIKQNLIKTAKKETISDKEDFEGIHDYTGMNVDDAFGKGIEEGEIFLAREILTALKIEYK